MKKPLSCLSGKTKTLARTSSSLVDNLIDQVAGVSSITSCGFNVMSFPFQ